LAIILLPYTCTQWPGFLAKFGYIIITSNGDMFVNGVNIDDLA